jgi:hypothetical protein
MRDLPLRHDDELARHRRLVRVAHDTEDADFVGGENYAMSLATPHCESLAERRNSGRMRRAIDTDKLKRYLVPFVTMTWEGCQM